MPTLMQTKDQINHQLLAARSGIETTLNILCRKAKASPSHLTPSDFRKLKHHDEHSNITAAKRDVMMASRNSSDPSTVYCFKNNIYLNITNRCTNDCYFCFRRFRSGIAGLNLRLKDEPSSDAIIEELKSMLGQRPCAEVVFCGFGEPTVRLETILEVAAWIYRKALKPIRLDTNGHALLLYPERPVAGQLRDAGVSSVSVSLNAHTKSIYNKICRPKLPNAFEKTLEFIKCSANSGLDTEITAVAIPEINISRVRELATNLGVRFRVRPYYDFIW